ncbi:MAG: Serine/threonine-protein kinase PrkC [bacterium ADurb.Bin363]|nr:MAG: Serine/threonine-protein kinase PrkC [bacterium ADurb.Bin363]
MQEVKIEEEKTFTLIAKLIGKPGVIIIKNKPEGATVFIDGKDKADVVELPGVPTGAHLIEIKKEGHENYSKEFSLKPGQKLVIDVTMEKLPEITPALEPTFTPVSEEVTPTALVEPNSSLPFIDNKYLLILLFVVLFLFLGGVIAFLTLFHKRKKKAIPDEKNKPRIFKGKRTGEVIKSDEVEIVREFSVESLLDASEVQEDDEDDEESPPYRPIGPYRESVKSIYPSSVEDMSPFEEKIQSISGFKPYKDKEDTIEEEPKNIPRRPHYNTYDMEQEEPVADKEESCYRKDGFDLKGEIGNNYGGLSIPQVRRPSSEEEVYEERQRVEKRTVEIQVEPYLERPRLNVKKPITQSTVQESMIRPQITPVDINPELVTEKRKEFSKGFLKPKRETREVSEGIFPRSISRETADVGLKSQETYDVGDKIEKKFMPVSAEQITTPTNELEPRMTSVVKEELPYKTYMRQNNLNQTDETSEIEEILKRVYLSTKRQVPARAHMILGDYEIIEKIGSGSMAKVYKAKRNFTNEIVAVKIPYEHLLNDEDFINRFFQEANKCKEINHPNIAKVYDAASNEDCIYMIMEFVDAMTLREILRLSGITNMDVLWSINFIIKICEGLNYLHSKRIIHSDIKPENIMVSPTGELKIMDYVTFKSVAQIGPTKGGFFAGTPHYMPPEVLSKDGVDERSDIYSLGIVFYELITGGVPFSGSNPLVIMKKHKEEEPLLLRKIVPSIPEEIEKIVLKMIAKAPRDRFSSVRVVSALLSGYLTMRATDKNYLKPKPFNYASDSYDNLNP